MNFFNALLTSCPKNTKTTCAAFSSWARDTADSYENAAFYLEGDTFDLCGGHASPDGNYHYHNTAGCLQEQAMIAAGTTVDEHSPQIGWAYVSLGIVPYTI